jgi:hypothetical protein
VARRETNMTDARIAEMAAKAGLSPSKFRAIMDMYCDACPFYQIGSFDDYYDGNVSAKICAATEKDICPMELVSVMWDEDAKKRNDDYERQTS